MRGTPVLCCAGGGTADEQLRGGQSADFHTVVDFGALHHSCLELAPDVVHLLQLDCLSLLDPPAHRTAGRLQCLSPPCPTEPLTETLASTTQPCQLRLLGPKSCSALIIVEFSWLASCGYLGPPATSLFHQHIAVNTIVWPHSSPRQEGVQTKKAPAIAWQPQAWR